MQRPILTAAGVDEVLLCLCTCPSREVAEDLAQRLVAATRFVVLQAPVAAVKTLVDLRADMATVEAGLAAGGLELGQVDHAAAFFKVASSSSTWTYFSYI